MAMAALERHGVGQDFVFEVSPVGRAVRYALRAVAADPGWEGTAVLVVGPARVLDEARDELAAGVPPSAT
jgi:hypothetical protein